MRYLLLLIIVLLVISCKSKTEPILNNFKGTTDLFCPKDGICSFETMQNRSLLLNYNNLGEIYPNIKKGNHLVIKFEYKRDEIIDAVDSSYREEVFIEIDPKQLELQTSDLKSNNIIFARWCYCKGQTGYYKVNEGYLSIKKLEEKKYSLSLDFKINEVPQVVSKIQHVFEL